MQKFSEWRNSLGFQALWEIIDFFEDGGDDFETNTNRKLWAQWHLTRQRFIYEDVGGDTVVSESSAAETPFA